MSDWAGAAGFAVLCVTVLIFNLNKLKYSKDPKDELLRAKQLLDQGLIESGDYEKIKGRLLKRIVNSD